MSRRLDDASAETFWPGYVDAVTNLVLNLLFVVVIMTVAVFMFAMELGRMQPKTKPEVTQKPPQAASADAPAGQERGDTGTSSATQSEALKLKEAQVAALQSRVQALESEARQRSRASPQADAATAGESRKAAGEGSPAATQGSASGTAAEPPKVISATAPASSPERGIEKTVPAGGPAGGIVIKFADDAVALVRSEVEELRSALGPVVAAGGAKIEVVVPTGFSEARRLGFYRAMAVRNQLIEMKVPANRIEISVRDGTAGADSSRVMVSPR